MILQLFPQHQKLNTSFLSVIPGLKGMIQKQSSRGCVFGGSVIKIIETSKRRILKSNALNALLMISMNDPKYRTLDHTRKRRLQILKRKCRSY